MILTYIKVIYKGTTFYLVRCPALSDCLIENIFCKVIRKCPLFVKEIENKGLVCNYKKNKQVDDKQEKLLESINSIQKTESKEEIINQTPINIHQTQKTVVTELKKIFENKGNSKLGLITGIFEENSKEK